MIAALRRLLGWSVAAALASSCTPTSPKQPEFAATSAPEGSATAAPRAGGAESAGLVGPGETSAPKLDVTDVGPPGATLLFVSGLKGYTEPCGCTVDLVLGGLDRITGYVSALKGVTGAAGVVLGGDFLFEHETIDPAAREQEIRKAEVLIAAAREMGVAATVLGPRDVANGVDFYLEKMAQAGIDVLGANVKLAGGAPLGPSHVILPVGSERVALIGAASPDALSLTPGLTVEPPRGPVAAVVSELAKLGPTERPTVTVLLFAGDIVAARTQLAELSGVDFVVVGHDPRNTDEVERIGGASTLEAYDQGRMVGRLKLVSPAGATGPWVNARRGSNEEAARLDRLIAGVEAQLAQLPGGSGEVPPIVTTLRARAATYRAEREAIVPGGGASFAPDQRGFYFEPVAMKPGYPVSATVTEAMRAYNEALQAINLAKVEEIPPVAEGAAAFVGVAECSKCHVEETKMWRTMQHAHAIETLQMRGKAFDRSCIGCHVTGYRKPGGSVLGNLRGLENVQCEQCHGPGSLHVANPTLVNVPGGTQRKVPESVCVECHNHEHSPRFNYSTYLPKVLGPGHGLP